MKVITTMHQALNRKYKNVVKKNKKHFFDIIVANKLYDALKLFNMTTSVKDIQLINYNAHGFNGMYINIVKTDMCSHKLTDQGYGFPDEVFRKRWIKCYNLISDILTEYYSHVSDGYQFSFQIKGF